MEVYIHFFDRLTLQPRGLFCHRNRSPIQSLASGGRPSAVRCRVQQEAWPNDHNFAGRPCDLLCRLSWQSSSPDRGCIGGDIPGCHCHLWMLKMVLGASDAGRCKGRHLLGTMPCPRISMRSCQTSTVQCARGSLSVVCSGDCSVT